MGDKIPAEAIAVLSQIILTLETINGIDNPFSYAEAPDDLLK